MKKFRFILMIVLAGIFIVGCSNAKDEKAIADLKKENAEKTALIEKNAKDAKADKLIAQDSIAKLNALIEKVMKSEKRAIYMLKQQNKELDEKLGNAEKSFSEAQGINCSLEDYVLQLKQEKMDVEEELSKMQKAFAQGQIEHSALKEKLQARTEMWESMIDEYPFISKRIKVTPEGGFETTGHRPFFVDKLFGRHKDVKVEKVE